MSLSGFLGFLNSIYGFSFRSKPFLQKNQCPCVFNCGKELPNGPAHTWRIKHVPVRTFRFSGIDITFVLGLENGLNS